MFMNDIPVLPAQAEASRAGTPEVPAGPKGLPVESFGDFPGTPSRVIAMAAKSLYFRAEQIENILSVRDFNRIKINNLPY